MPPRSRIGRVMRWRGAIIVLPKQACPLYAGLRSMPQTELPAATLLARGNCLFVQQAGDGANAETLNAVQFEHPTHYASLLFVDLEARSGVICLANKPISERSAAQHANFSLAGAMSFAASRAFQNLRAFVLRDHSLGLHEQFVLWCRTARRAHRVSTPARANSSIRRIWYAYRRLRRSGA